MTFWTPVKPRRDPIFETPSEMWDRCVAYFDWVKENPLIEKKIFMFQGGIVDGELTKPRAMTITGMCVFVGLNRSTWETYRTREGFADVCELVASIILTQKIELAAADMLNANFIAKEIGLRDQKDINHTSVDGSMSPTRIELVAPDVDRED